MGRKHTLYQQHLEEGLHFFASGSACGKGCPAQDKSAFLGTFSRDVTLVILSGFLSLKEEEMKTVSQLTLRHLPSLFYNHPIAHVEVGKPR